MDKLTLLYWLDDGWYVGKIKEVPGVFSQGETLIDLVENIKEVYQLMIEDNNSSEFLEGKKVQEIVLAI